MSGGDAVGRPRFFIASLRGVGGEVWAEFPDGETVFAFSLPARRAQDGRPRAGPEDGASPAPSS